MDGKSGLLVPPPTYRRLSVRVKDGEIYVIFLNYFLSVCNDLCWNNNNNNNTLQDLLISGYIMMTIVRLYECNVMLLSKNV